eukprot:5689158-Alexandrium_andersonii.AAC.1
MLGHVQSGKVAPNPGELTALGSRIQPDVGDHRLGGHPAGREQRGERLQRTNFPPETDDHPLCSQPAG